MVLVMDQGRPDLGLDGQSRGVLGLWARSLELTLGSGEESRAATKLEVVRLSGPVWARRGKPWGTRCRGALGLMVDQGWPGHGLDGRGQDILGLWAKISSAIKYNFQRSEGCLQSHCGI